MKTNVINLIENTAFHDISVYFCQQLALQQHIHYIYQTKLNGTSYIYDYN